MVRVEFKNVQKIYENGFHAVHDFNLEIKDKEFIVFVGPSGCGKSTTLRMLAGLEEITDGDIFIDDQEINYVAPKDRNIAMVFQSYALYPHMSVYKNIAFGLKLRKALLPKYDKNGNQEIGIDELKINQLQKAIKKISIASNLSIELKEEKIALLNQKIENLKKESKPLFVIRNYTKKEIDERVKDVALTLGLSEYLETRPKALSGGQRQRVALGRAIVRNPKLFLMDEPLSNLDAKLRVQMRSELINIHRKAGAITIYVTHDQIEAMTMADRIVIMKDGYVQQIGTPEEIYNNPANIFVAGFIGSPAMNFFNANFNGDYLTLEDGQKIYLTKPQISALKNYINKDICVGIRPENIEYHLDEEYSDDMNIIKIKPNIVEFLGDVVNIHTKISQSDFIIKATVDRKKINMEGIKVKFKNDKLHLFDIDSNNKIDF